MFFTAYYTSRSLYDSYSSIIMTIALLILIFLVPSALLALIPSSIAKNKGYSAGLWWLYGWFLFIIATIHAALLPDKNQKPPQVVYMRDPEKKQDSADEILKYKSLLDQGAITPEEFQRKKDELLNSH